MAAPMTAAQTRVAMKKWRVPFKEYSGWTTRKRPGSFAPVGLVIHHTGSDGGQNSASYDHFLFVEGRPAEGIPGPLCQATCEMDGDLILGAIGRANHAGSGSSRTLATVRADKAPTTATIKPGPDDTNGNGWFYGLEVKFDGGQPMTAKQYDSAVRWAAAICDFYKWTAGSIVGHKEWSSRKPDPGSTFMGKFRADVNARLKAGPGGAPTGGTPTTSEGDLTVADAQAILNYLEACTIQIQKHNDQTVLPAIAKVDAKVTAEASKSLGRYQRMEAIQTINTTQFTEVDQALAAANTELAGLRADHDALKCELNDLKALVAGLAPKA